MKNELLPNHKELRILTPDLILKLLGNNKNKVVFIVGREEYVDQETIDLLKMNQILLKAS